MNTNIYLPSEDLVRVTAFQELFGGFGHELAQPLNKIMLAAQVIQLRIDRSDVNEDEKSFFRQRIEIICSEVESMVSIINGMRRHTKSKATSEVDKDIMEIFHRVHDLIGQQLNNLSIDLKIQDNRNGQVMVKNAVMAESIFVQFLARARETIQERFRHHSDKQLPYEKKITIQLDDDVNRCKISFLLPENRLGSSLPPIVEESVGFRATIEILSKLNCDYEELENGFRFYIANGF